LAGFLKKIPKKITQKFAGNIINIHPALLPKYGGKGMYGEHVHKAVLANGEQKSGITIHLVDDIYDNGEIIFQSSFDISSDETLESLSKKIAKQEHTHFPKVIHQFLEKQMLR
jgi:phosphoribosylglycinamide formyltransferase-1